MGYYESKDFILTKRIHDVVYELIPKTRANMVYMDEDDKVTLTEKIIDIFDMLNKQYESQEALKEAIEKILGPQTEENKCQFQTFVDVWNYVNVSKDSTSTLAKMFKTKVDVEDGKGLSTNDFDDAMKKKLIDTYTKMEVNGLMVRAANQIQTLSEIVHSLDKATNERVTKIKKIVLENDESLKEVKESVTQQIEKLDSVQTQLDNTKKRVTVLENKDNIIVTSDSHDGSLDALKKGVWYQSLS